MNSLPIVKLEGPMIYIGYKYNSQNFLGFIYTERYGGTVQGVDYLFSQPGRFSRVNISPCVLITIISRYLNVCSGIYQQNKMWQYYLEIEKYWVTWNDCFRIGAKVSLDIVITDVHIILFYGILTYKKDKDTSMRRYTSGEVFDFFGNNFLFNCDSPDINIPPVASVYVPLPNKIDRNSSDTLPDTIYVASKNSLSIPDSQYETPTLIFPISRTQSK